MTAKTAANFWRERQIKGSLVMIASMSGSIANRSVLALSLSSEVLTSSNAAA